MHTPTDPADSAVSPDICVGIVMTCYNEGRYIGAAVRSVLAQTCIDHISRIVIADDGSDADTLSVLRDIESWDRRIDILYGPGGGGVSTQRNLAIACMPEQVNVLAILDGDDLWAPTKLERQLPVLSARPEVGLVYGGFYTFADDLSHAQLAPVIDITRSAALSSCYFLTDPPIIPSTTLMRRSDYERCGGFHAHIKVFEDTDLFVRMARICRFGFVAEPLLYKRHHAVSITGGRQDLMAHHAYVALIAAAAEPALLDLVPKRLAERARKLGNHRFLSGDLTAARSLLRLAVRINPLNHRAWLSLLAASLAPRLSTRILSTRMQAKRVSMGLSAST